MLVLFTVFICFQCFQLVYRTYFFQWAKMNNQDSQTEHNTEKSQNDAKRNFADVIHKILKEKPLRDTEEFDRKEIKTFTKRSDSSSTTTTTTTSTTTIATTSTQTMKQIDGSTRTKQEPDVKLSVLSGLGNDYATDAVQAKIAENIRSWRTSTAQKMASDISTTKYDGRDLLKDSVFKADPNFKNPCWFEEETLRCLPYVFVIGVKKCGTSDLFYRLSLHPDFIRPGFKEAQWFARGRFKRPSYDDINRYVDMFSKAAFQILENSSKGKNGTLHNYIHVTGEGSPSNLHLNTHWKNLPGNENLDEPRYVILDYIQHFIPSAKLIMTFRDPVDRLYSDYYHEYGSLMKTNRPNPRQFHKVVSEGVKLYQDCFKRRSVRSCVYEPSLYAKTKVQIQLGIYYIFWQELLRLFPRDQILVLQNENLRDKENTMRRVYEFLGLRKLSDDEMDVVVNRKETYTRRQSFKDQGPMLNETLQILTDFYRPFNKKMAELANDNDFLYKNVNKVS